MMQLILVLCVSHALALYPVDRISKVDGIVNAHFDLLKPKLEKITESKLENKSSTDDNNAIFNTLKKVTKHPEINEPPFRVDLENPNVESDNNKDTPPTMLSALLPVIDKQNMIEDMPIKSIEFPPRKAIDGNPLFGQVHILHKMLRQLKKDTTKINHEPKLFENKIIEEIKPINQSIENEILIKKQETMTQEVKAIEELVRNVKSELASIQNSKQTESEISTTIIPENSTIYNSTDTTNVTTESKLLELNSTLGDDFTTLAYDITAEINSTDAPTTSTEQINNIISSSDPTADVKNIVDSYIHEKYDIDELVRGMQDKILQTIDQGGNFIKTRNNTNDSSTIELSFNYNKAEHERALLQQAAVERAAMEKSAVENPKMPEGVFPIGKETEKTRTVNYYPDANKLHRLERKIEDQAKAMKKLDKKLTNLMKLVKKSNNYKLYSILPDDMHKLQRGQVLKVLMKPRPQRGHKRFTPLSMMSDSASISSSSSEEQLEDRSEEEEFAPPPNFYQPEGAGMLPSGMKGNKRKYRWKMNGSMKI